MQKITPCLWFNNNIEEAASLYTSIFKNSKVGKTTHYDSAAAKVSGMPEGAVMTIEFSLDGQDFLGLNGGPAFKFTEAVSFIINCDTQEEVDHFWYKLIEGGGEESQCGWLKDKFGVSWQVTPKRLTELTSSSDPVIAKRAMEAMLTMKKIDIAALEKAVQGE